MGRQTSVAMAPEDEAEFLRFLRSSAEIQLLVPFAPSSELLSISQLPPPGPGHWTHYIWNRRFSWSPEYAQVRANAASHPGWYYHSDIHVAPVIEYHRHNFAGGGLPGRIYWAGSFASPHPLAYDHNAFSTWFGQVVRWLRSRGVKHAGPHRSTYFLPVAWANLEGAR